MIVPQETSENVAQKLARISYQSPTVPVAHSCRGCASKLLPGQPCGAYCQRCNEEIHSLELIERPTRSSAEIIAFITGLIAGMILLAVCAGVI